MKLSELISRLNSLKVGDPDVEFKAADEALMDALTIDNVYVIYDGERKTVLLEGAQ